MLDGDLAGRRTERQGLLVTLQGDGVRVVGERLRYPLPDQQQRQQQAQRQQAIERGAGHVDPEVAQGGAGTSGDAPAQGDQHGQAGGGADEVLHGEAEHLAEIADRYLATVGLPVGVGDEAHRRVERQ
ncbi:hypothetical protein D3C76_433280 [compost metagenome]